jgi:hypothetical protein
MDSRIQRFLRSHPYWAPKWIQEQFPHYSIQRIEDEQQRAQGVWQEISSDAASGYGWGPQPQWSRDAAFGYVWRAEGTEDRNALTWPINRRKRVRATIWDCRVEADFDERAIARLQRWGRNDYANWLAHRRRSTCKPYVVRDGRLKELRNEPPAPFKSKVAHYWDDKPPIVAELTSIDGRSLKPLPIVGAAQEEESFWNAREPSKLCRALKTINLTSPVAKPSIIPDHPINVEAVAVPLEGGHDTETAAFETSEHSGKPRSKMARARSAD